MDSDFMDWESTRGHIENKSYDVFRWELSCCFQFDIINIITFDFDDVEFAFLDVTVFNNLFI